MSVSVSVPLKSGVGAIIITSENPSADDLTISIPGMDKFLSVSREDLFDAMGRIGPPYAQFDHGLQAVVPRRRL